MLSFWTVVLEKTLESPLGFKDCNQSILKRSVLGVHWKDWCWSWNSNTLSTWFEALTHWKRPWCWERLRTGGEGDDRGWVGWMASPTQWTWAWVNSRSWWWTGRPGVLQFMGLQRVGHDWATELNWTDMYTKNFVIWLLSLNSPIATSLWITWKLIKSSLFQSLLPLSTYLTLQPIKPLNEYET